MNVLTTALNDRPVKNRTLLPQPRSAPVLGRSNVKMPANEGLYQMTRSWPQGVRQISGTRPPQPSSADWQSAESPAGRRLGARTCQPRCHPAETLKKTALGINLSPEAKNVFLRALRAIRGQPEPFPRRVGVPACRLPHRPDASSRLPQTPNPRRPTTDPKINPSTSD
jgi:hypothetical protein